MMVLKVMIVKMLVTVIVLSSFTLFSAEPVAAQSSAPSSTDDFPSSMLGFIENGMHIGVRYNRRPDGMDEHFMLRILDEDGYNITIESRSLSLDELRKRYPVIESLASKTLEEYNERLPERIRTLPKGKQYSKPELSVESEPGLFMYKVVHVGDDYLLVSYGDKEDMRRVLPKHLIKYIDWGDGLPTVSARSKIVDAEEAEPSAAR